ncbi:hypothetical protein H696_03272 [Fonticula alba]|uniref:Uncharacterized protein n=1 Tax=Fonticula alba TaxID=691883 RepID=A0A058Z8F0_FONAL|nr:hypothetical protein H696_03272 [Fonticula alba]KCV69812.1 hypothetical protein H696_03272 [Fonticula alba]|eukprot:XP_009495418.1 hypothetical protein H696_03272 [Fonticula alba]
MLLPGFTCRRKTEEALVKGPPATRINLGGVETHASAAHFGMPEVEGACGLPSVILQHAADPSQEPGALLDRWEPRVRGGQGLVLVHAAQAAGLLSAVG